MKNKIILISTTSPSTFLSTGKGSIDEILRDDWFAQVAIKIKEFYPKMEVECWALEKTYKKEKDKFFHDIKFRVFPSNFAVRVGMEISYPMICALMSEQKTAEKNGKKMIFHFHEYHSWQVYLMLLFMKTGNRIIAQHHGGRSPLRNLMKYKRLILFLPAVVLMQFFENLLFKKVDLFYALGNEEEKYLIKVAPKSEIKFQTMGIEDIYFKEMNKEKARKLIGLNKDKKYVLYLGRIKTTKGVRELIRAMKEVDEAELLMIGEGPDYKKSLELAKTERIENVRFLGAIYGEKKLDYLSATDCLILPSHTEGAPVVLMEAIAKNLPVIATRVGGIPRMIKNGREGILINAKSKDEIVRAIKEILTWKKKNIKKYANIYKWKNIIDATVRDYLKK